MSEVEFERWENGQSGYVTHSDPSKLTAEFVATFNRLRFEEWQQQVQIMLRQPDKYADYTPKHFPVYVGACYDKSEGWVRLHEFEVIRTLAGIPEHIAITQRLFNKRPQSGYVPAVGGWTGNRYIQGSLAGQFKPD
ncbi:hypothetical protein KBJ94_23095 [Pseudomonas sp. ITA]|uniref:hypothetical protein n=1 Tax=Pseudomonas sp. ITA TaxID=2825841 RepID=UPI0024990A5B|nr:hypothetical protein [Pseudomonas sp. ITA]MDI2144939.1 hypothetical protein [Pseudomonas sp. ITA]